jgi:hypothetical protein
LKRWKSASPKKRFWIGYSGHERNQGAQVKGRHSGKKSSLPETRDLRHTHLIGTIWSTKPDGDLKGAFHFTKDGKFEREKVTTRYIITGDDSVKIIWSGNVQIECKFSGGFTKFREVNGNKTTFFFRGVKD